jgi:hypothetical protein
MCVYALSLLLVLEACTPSPPISAKTITSMELARMSAWTFFDIGEKPVLKDCFVKTKWHLQR